MLSALVYAFFVLAFAGVIAGTVLYFYREKQNAQKEEKDGFRSVLLQQLRKRGSAFDFRKLVESEEVSEAVAHEVAIELYTQSCEQAFVDGVVTEAERRNLNSLAQVLAVTTSEAQAIESKLANSRYRKTALGLLSDGTITEAELADLSQLRTQLGLSTQQSSDLISDVSHEAYVALFRRVSSDGRITSSEMEELKRFRQAMGASQRLANDLVRDEVLMLYRQWFFNVIQDGEVTLEEEAALRWLQEEFDLKAHDVQKYQEQIDEIKRLDSYRKGNLPSVRTRQLLEGGEICHWEGRCCFEWKTPTMVKTAEGDLIVTSERVVFTSHLRSFSFSPAKIMDIRIYSDALVLMCASGRGAGTYFVHSPRELEAVLVGIAKRHKYQTCTNFDSTMTRHIPETVRREVWHRDGGKCVRCGATDYLEFDHIIPHAKGGANSAKNVQLLCRRCNNLKSDRI